MQQFVAIRTTTNNPNDGEAFLRSSISSGEIFTL